MALEISNITADQVSNPVLAKSLSLFQGPLLTNIMWAFLILIVGLIIGKIAGSLLLKLFEEIELNQSIKRMFHIDVRIDSVLGAVISKTVYVIAIFFALSRLGLATIVFNTIAIVILVIIIILIIMGLKDFIPNLIAGLILHRKKLIQTNDIVEIDKVKGKVVYLDLLQTRIETDSGDIIHIPNSHISKTRMKVKKR